MTINLAQAALLFTSSRWWLLAAFAAITVLLLPVSTFGQFTLEPVSNAKAPNVPHFVTVPTPEELGALLYPPRARSMPVSFVPQSDVPAQPAHFSMAIHFAYDSAKLLPPSQPMLDSIGEMLNLPKVRHEGLIIEGHTDGRGSKRYNASLALRRAQAIKRYLADRHHINPIRMLTVSFGETRLVNSEDPTHPRNRRAAFRPMRLDELFPLRRNPK